MRLASIPAPFHRAAFSLFLGFAVSGCIFAEIANAQTPESVESSQADETQDPAPEYPEMDPPPITRIVMFNSGLWQIVHEGKVEGKKRVKMKFTGHDVDDVLKSLVFQDKSGGVVRSVEYKPAPDSEDVAAQQLGPPMTMAQMLQKYRGEEVTLKVETSEIRGNIFGVENRQTDDEFVETLTIVNDEGFLSIPLNQCQFLQFDSQELRTEFKQAMAGLKKSRTKNLKEIELLFEGEGKRDVRYTYNVDAPIWRMTYRLDLDAGKSSMQGWAHIDNVTGVAWKEIQLDLRSGRPQSFHVELFAPVVAERTAFDLDVYDIPSDKVLIPQYFGSEEVGRRPNRNQGGGFGGGGRGGGGFGGSGGGGGVFRLEPDTPSMRSIQDEKPSKSNRMVRFVIKEPVTLAGGRSAMVPVLNENLPVELYSMFSGAKNEESAPMIAQIENKLETPLIRGPITLYRDGDFVGDGALERIEPTESNEFVYGQDMAVRKEVKRFNVDSKTTAVKLSAGKVMLSVRNVYKVEYQLTNEDNLPRKFLLKAPVRSDDAGATGNRNNLGNRRKSTKVGAVPNTNLVTRTLEPKPLKVKDGLAHYKLECPGSSDVKLATIETEVLQVTKTIGSITSNDVDSWKKDNADIGAVVLDRLEKISAARTELANAREAYRAISNSISETKKEQTRLTGLIRVLDAKSNNAKKYLEKLDQSESELEELNKKEAELETLVEKLNDNLDLLLD